MSLMEMSIVARTLGGLHSTILLSKDWDSIEFSWYWYILEQYYTVKIFHGGYVNILLSYIEEREKTNSWSLS
jgi:hypothetical protein